MPRSSHTRKGVTRRKQRGATAPEYRCRFCRRKQGTGHRAGCVGEMAELAGLSRAARSELIWGSRGDR
jgi:hypothetical protein